MSSLRNVPIGLTEPQITWLASLETISRAAAIRTLIDSVRGLPLTPDQERDWVNFQTAVLRVAKGAPHVDE